MTKGRICGFPDCGRPHVARGYCRTHYLQAMQGRPLTPIPPRQRNKGKPCRVEGCKRPAEGRGLCSAHRAQLYKGRPLTPPKPPKAEPEPAAARSGRRRRRNECSTPGCGNNKGFTELCPECFGLQFEEAIRSANPAGWARSQEGREAWP